MRMLVDQELARRNEPGATAEVFGCDDAATLKLLAVKVAQPVRRIFKATYSLQHRELYAFVQRYASHPRSVIFIP